MIAELKARLTGEQREALTPEAETRLENLLRISPLYCRILLNHPEYVPWLEAGIDWESEEQEGPREKALLSEWHEFAGNLASDSSGYLDALRSFRRRMTLRLAYRDVNELASCARTVHDLSSLAELCIRECYLIAQRRWYRRYGEPWDEEFDRPARFCVLALGKLGGRELNFSSDIDLIYFYEGDGYCRNDGKSGAIANQQCFTKVGETMTASLQEQTEHGFLYRTDLRLRPEGARSPLVRSFAGMEHYYAAAGQSWERMALIKARPVAGDFALGGELMESLHSFRYPRHAPPTLLMEIGAMKARTEKEVVGAENMEQNIKSGYGGIREIEFVAQTMQLLHAGRNPFLQTQSTVECLSQLARYRLIEEETAERLREAYWFLRTLENRIQMHEEQQTHNLPSDAGHREALARSFGHAGWDAFLRRLNVCRDRVHGVYREVVPAGQFDEDFNAWWAFFCDEKMLPEIRDKVERWFGPGEDAAREVRHFIRGDAHRGLTQDQVNRFRKLAESFDGILPSLASPRIVLQRVSSFAERYGTRSQFLQACSSNPHFFRILAILFDRSRFIFETLCQHPEIFDEVLRPEVLRRKKSREETIDELRAMSEGRDLAESLWLYVRAEQIRLAIGELLEFSTPEQSASSLATLADAVVLHLLEHLRPPGNLCIVALGKYGGHELTFGADLDVIFVGEETHLPEQEKTVRQLTRLLSRKEVRGPVYEVDLRLRPHGKAGPLVTTLPALKKYHADGGAGRAWEKQALTRARPIDEDGPFAAGFLEFRDTLIYSVPIPAEDTRELWRLRRRIENERDRVEPRERAYKTAAGGLIDLEFLAQFYQLLMGAATPELRSTNTRDVLRQLALRKSIPETDAETILSHFAFLKRIESNLRRDRNRPVSIIPGNPDDQAALAHWLGFESFDVFWKEHCKRMQETRRLVMKLLTESLRLPLDEDGS